METNQSHAPAHTAGNDYTELCTKLNDGRAVDAINALVAERDVLAQEYREACAERAAVVDALTAKLGDAEAQRDALKAALLNTVAAWHKNPRNFERELVHGTPSWLADARAALALCEKKEATQ